MYATLGEDNSAMTPSTPLTDQIFPTLVNPAEAAQSVVTGTTDTLSVLGAIYGGSESSLVYTWSVTPSSSATFSANGTNAAKNTAVTFTAAGNYTFTVTIASGTSSIISSTTVLVTQTLTTIKLTPNAAALLPGATQQFTAEADDQFGSALTDAPDFYWSVPTGAGTVDQAGLFSAPSQGGQATVEASAGGINGLATVAVYAKPSIAAPAAAVDLLVTGKTDTLSVLGALDGGSESSLIYVWSATPSSSATYSENDSNAAKNTTVTFTATGAYDFTVTIVNGISSITSNVTVNVELSTSSVRLTPNATDVLPHGTKQFSATAYDQFGNPMGTQPDFQWSVSAGKGSVDQNGLFTAPAQPGQATVKSSADGVAGEATVSISEGVYKVAITGRAYEQSYSAADTSGDLSATKTDWFAAPTPEDAVQQAITGTVTLETRYDPSHPSRAFPDDLNRPDGYGFSLLASDDEGAPNTLTWDAAKAQYTGAIGLWDGDPQAARDWDFYWNITVDAMSGVNSTADAAALDPTKSPVTGNLNANGDPEVTLKSIIQFDNASSDPVPITFDIPTTDSGYNGQYYDIKTNDLPTITESEEINGETQPGYSNSPVVAVDGGGFTVSSDETTIEGLDIINAETGIHLTTGEGSDIEGNYIGIKPDGTTKAGNTVGVLIDDSASNTVASNVISGNLENGISITGAGATDNAINNNLVGTDATGNASSAIFQNGDDGILIAGGASFNTVDSNTISRNFGNGVHISGQGTSDNTISNDSIGTAKDGGTPENPGLGNGHDGVLIDGGASSNTVSSSVISANLGNGAHITGPGTTKNIFSQDTIGLDKAGDAITAFGNLDDGVLIDGGASSNTFTHDTISESNTGNGVHITGAGTNTNTISNSNIGVTAAGKLAGNDQNGVLIEAGANSNTIGPFNAISGNNQNGVHISSASQCSILQNEIGTDEAGGQAAANGADGVLIDGGGSQNSITQNTISGNSQNGVHLSGDGSSSNTISDNQIGVDITEESAIANGGDGVLIEAKSSNNILAADTIGGNAKNGVHISGDGTAGNVISGSFIGVAPDGTTSLANSQSGVLIDAGAASNTIGAAFDADDTSAGNTVAFNTLDGVTITGDGTVDNPVLQNSIYNNQRLGINLGGGAARLPNDDQDPDTGANNLQNYPIVTAVRSNGSGGTDITGQLNSTPDSTFRVELFGNEGSDSNWGLQGRSYLGAAENVTTDADGNGSFALTVPGDASNVTATATDSNGNTSEEFGVRVDLDILDTGPITPQAENSTHDNDVVANGGLDSLGVLPMGQGRVDFPGSAYTNATENIATVSGATSSLQFRWTRTVAFRSWSIHFDGTQWVVTQRGSGGVTTGPTDDTGPSKFFTTTLSPSNKLYDFDDSALVLSADEISAAVGDYVYEEKQFNYQLDIQIDGVWYTFASQNEGQVLNAKRDGTTGVIAADWNGIENSFSARTLSVQITEEKVRAIVGGTDPISIDPDANK